MIVAEPGGNFQRRIERRRLTAPFRLDAYTRLRIAPAAALAEIIKEIIEMEVEPGAGADLDQRQRQTPARRDDQQAAEENAGARNLVGLRRRVEKAGQLFVMATDRRANRRPECVRIRRRTGRINLRELRLWPGAHVIVQGATAAQRHEIAAQRRDRPGQHTVTKPTRLIEPICQSAAEKGGEGGPELVAPLRLEPKRVADLCLRVCHASNT